MLASVSIQIFTIGKLSSYSNNYLEILIGIVVLWFAISIPLALLGSYLGFKKPVSFYLICIIL